jgi:hypothetical protein
MSSSKFSSPFFKKSPLQGAYSSGADGIVTVSDLPHYQKLQQDLVAGTLATFTPEAIDEDMKKTIDKRGSRIETDSKTGKETLNPSKFNKFFGGKSTDDPNEISKFKDKTTKLETKLASRKKNRKATSQETLANACIDKKGGGYIGYDPDLNEGKGGCY